MFNSAPFNQEVFNYAAGVTTLKQDLCIAGQLVAKSTDSSFPLMFSYLDGLTMTVSLRDPAATAYFADFADGAMKNTGWTTKYKEMIEVTSGVYMTTVDVSALTGITGNSLSVEYVIGGDDYSGFLTSILTIDDVNVEGIYDQQKALRLILSAVAGELSGASSTSIAIRDTGDTKNRISATVDADGNRTAVTLDAT